MHESVKNINNKIAKIIHDENKLIENIKVALKQTRSFDIIDFTVDFVCNFLQKLD